MNEQSDLVTVFRSADVNAQDEAEQIRDLLAEAGLSPVLLDDNALGVPEGVFEVCVPQAGAERADKIMAANADSVPEKGDPSHDLDLETIFEEMGPTAEVEAFGVRSVLDANQIQYIYIEPSQYPNLPFVIKVPKKYVAQALQALEEAKAAGAEAAEEGERESERGELR